ncbi:amidohydrolase family protein [Noviherbaspirillum pedocola]|uniref:Amidohydrolase family protein n=1 Tax=Noviherbaspirillum pedocola TaxID=2801341 RepID=A0A934SYA6_9BURK|nr:amidohydrolase family protein [Noviherbaspirillum pedocola]MBK4735107.1 amidohydrolase family protein [Noviherbaspirillum pedocola]
MKKESHVAIVDTHAHIFQRGLPLASVRRYAPDYDALLVDYLGMLDAHGIARGVLVQPSFLGIDNSYLLAGLAAAPARLRGIAVVAPDVDAGELVRLDAAGVVGLRLNLVGGAALPDLRSPPWRALLRSAVDLGWHVEVHREARDLPLLLAPLLEAGVNVVVDHFGRPDPAKGVDDSGFRALLEAGASRRVWVKLSAVYRNGANGVGERIARDAMPLLRRAFGPERLLWGSDWPHTRFEDDTSVAASLALLETLLPDAAARRIVLNDAPNALYRFVDAGQSDDGASGDDHAAPAATKA